MNSRKLTIRKGVQNDSVTPAPLHIHQGQKGCGHKRGDSFTQMCGPNDIITPIMPADERIRVGTRGEPRNYSDVRLPQFIRSRKERRYLKAVASATPQTLPSISHPRAPFTNHMSLSDVLRNVPKAGVYEVIFVERSPYAKVVSLANWRTHSATYSSGGSLAGSADAVSIAVDRIIASGRIGMVCNIDGYRDLQGRIRGTCWKVESLSNQVTNFFRSRGLDPVSLVHAKRGLNSDVLDPSQILRPDQIELINNLFAEEFETFGWPMIKPA